jgi:hypothetical protein
MKWIFLLALGFSTMGCVSYVAISDVTAERGDDGKLVIRFDADRDVTRAAQFVGAGITFLVGAGVTHFHTIGTPVALTSIAFLVGLLLLPFGEETRGQVLPT